DVDIDQASGCSRGAYVGFLVRHVLGIGQQAVFEVVDPYLGSFLVADRAEVTGNLQAPLVSFLDHGTKLVASDVHISLERGGSLVRPEVHNLSSVFDTGHLSHYWRERSLAFKIGSVYVHL